VADGTSAAVVMLQAQIGGESKDDFERNTILSTKMVLEACRHHGLNHLVHVSSSVVNSMARDWYVESKMAQERLVIQSGIPHVILRPTLMFGWFDRKHLGWLSRFMMRVPVFPVPGSGQYLRQPLYVMDFCAIILSCLQRTPDNNIYDISGREKLTYIELITKIREITSSPTRIVRVPYVLFWALLKTYALFDRNPPFTTRQLEALVIPEEFPVIPWWDIFGVAATPIDKALQKTFGPSPYTNIVLEF
jgi:nucleoside-diphosphate-sugar epimerase